MTDFLLLEWSRPREAEDIVEEFRFWLSIEASPATQGAKNSMIERLAWAEDNGGGLDGILLGKQSRVLGDPRALEFTRAAFVLRFADDADAVKYRLVWDQEPYVPSFNGEFGWLYT